MKFTYGFTTKTIKGKEYVYFWKYTGTGQKTEQYVGRADKPATAKKALQIKLAYLKGLQQEIAECIRQTRKDLESLNSLRKPTF